MKLTMGLIEALIAGALLLGFSGCIAVPAGTKELRRHEMDRRTVESAKLIGYHVSAEIRRGEGDVLVSTVGTYERQSHEVVRYTAELSKRRIVIGMAPADGASKFGDRRTISVLSDEEHPVNKNPDVTAFVLGPIIWGLVLAATPFTWLTEFGHDWEDLGPPIDHSHGSYGIDWSFVGWAKTTRLVTSPVMEAEENQRTDTVQRPVPSAVVKGRFDNGFRFEAKTDAAGTASLPTGKWPLVGSREWCLTLSSSEDGISTPETTIGVPGEVLGRDLNLWERLANLDFDVLHVDSATVDFATGPVTANPSPRVSTEIIGRKPEAPEVFSLRITVENIGKGPLYRFLGRTVAEETALDKQLMIFGRIGPGKRVTRDLRLPVAKDFRTGRYKLTVEFREANGNAPPSEEMMIDVD